MIHCIAYVMLICMKDSTCEWRELLDSKGIYLMYTKNTTVLVWLAIGCDWMVETVFNKRMFGKILVKSEDLWMQGSERK